LVFLIVQAIDAGRYQDTFSLKCRDICDLANASFG
jgi:hypothetical protein